MGRQCILGIPADRPRIWVGLRHSSPTRERQLTALSGSSVRDRLLPVLPPQLPFTEGAQHGLVRLETWSAVASMLFGLALFRRVGPWDLVCVRFRGGRIRINRWPANSICYGDADHIGIGAGGRG